MIYKHIANIILTKKLFSLFQGYNNDMLGCNLCFHGHIMFLIICQTVELSYTKLQVQN